MSELESVCKEQEVTFESLRSKGQVLNYKNIKLLNIINTQCPQSITELMDLTGRHKSNLSRTLKTLQRHGVVSLKKYNNGVIPVVLIKMPWVDT